MTDRELLEMAAKAAGMIGNTTGEMLDPTWNPLTDDADALCLAVKLGLIIDCDYQSAMPHNKEGKADDWSNGFEEGDPYAATRRAIVRAAAIGEQQCKE